MDALTVAESRTLDPRLEGIGILIPLVERVLDIGVTYFIQGEEGGPIKIGFTKNRPSERLTELQIGSPVKLRFVGFMRGRREPELHRQFAHLRLHGEWFDNETELCDFIQENTLRPKHHG